MERCLAACIANVLDSLAREDHASPPSMADALLAVGTACMQTSARQCAAAVR